jgi:apolipoprotein N-acyltransferase
MRYFRTAPKLWRGLAGLYVVFLLAMPIMWLGLWPFPPLVMAKISAMGAAFSVVPYLLDRLSESRIRGIAQTLVFPSSAVALEFVFMLRSSQTTWGNIAYTQTENLPLLQFASIAGIWGITFVMLWLAPVANNLWRSGWSDGRARSGVLAYGLVLGAVVLFGSSRLAFFAPSGDTFRVASVTPPEILDLIAPEDVPLFQQLMMKQEVDEEAVARLQATLVSTYDPLLEDTRREARAGADLVVWPEGSLISFDEEQDAALIEEGRRLAQEEDIYLAMTIALVPGASGPPNENRLLLISPEGEIVQTYWKHYTVPVIEEPFAVPGSEKPLVYETAFTTLGGVICYDMDSYRFLQIAGRDGVDVLVAPSGDWPMIKELHSAMALVRGVEQGFSLVRPANHGLNVVADYQGRVLARLDHYTTSDRRLSAAVPERGVTTVYQRTGDLLPWLCLVLTVLFVALLVRRRVASDSA